MQYEEATPVTHEDAVEAWIATELEKVDDHQSVDVPHDLGDGWRSRLSLGEKEHVLVAVTDGPGDVWRHCPLEWYRVTLTRSEFESLRAIPWPDTYGWGHMSRPDGLVSTVAERLHRGERPVDDFVDGEFIRELADGDEWPISRPPIVVQCTRESSPALFDGNHRATAAALRLLRGEEYCETTAYVGLQTPLRCAEQSSDGL